MFDVYPTYILWWTALDRGRTLSISYFYVILEQIITNIRSKQEAAAKWKICSSMSSE